MMYLAEMLKCQACTISTVTIGLCTTSVYNNLAPCFDQHIYYMPLVSPSTMCLYRSVTHYMGFQMSIVVSFVYSSGLGLQPCLV